MQLFLQVLQELLIFFLFVQCNDTKGPDIDNPESLEKPQMKTYREIPKTVKSLLDEVQVVSCKARNASVLTWAIVTRRASSIYTVDIAGEVTEIEYNHKYLKLSVTTDVGSDDLETGEENLINSKMRLHMKEYRTTIIVFCYSYNASERSPLFYEEDPRKTSITISDKDTLKNPKRPGYFLMAFIMILAIFLSSLTLLEIKRYKGFTNLLTLHRECEGENIY